MGIAYVLVEIRTQILALILLLIMPTDSCNTELFCLLVQYVGPIDYLTKANSFTLRPDALARE